MHHCADCGAEFMVARDACSDCGGAIVAGPSPRFAAAMPRAKATPSAPAIVDPPAAVVLAGPRPELPPSGLRHCRACHAEFDCTLLDCSDCGAPLFPGGSPRFETGTASTADQDSLSPEEFSPLRRIDNGWQADMLCSVLADAGIATLMLTARGRRMRAPGLEPMGPAPAENESVEILVFPELLDEARGILDEAQDEQSADDEEIVVPTDGPGAGCGPACETAAAPPQQTSPVVFLLAGLVVVVGVAAALLFR